MKDQAIMFYRRWVWPVLDGCREWWKYRILKKPRPNVRELCLQFEKAKKEGRPRVLSFRCRRRIPYMGYDLIYAFPERGIGDWEKEALASEAPDEFVQYWAELGRIYEQFTYPRRSLTQEDYKKVLEAVLVFPRFPPEFVCDVLLADESIGMPKREVYEMFRIAYGNKKFQEVMRG